MSSKQITVLGLVAATALSFGIFFNHQPSTAGNIPMSNTSRHLDFYLSVGMSTSSAAALQQTGTRAVAPSPLSNSPPERPTSSGRAGREWFNGTSSALATSSRDDTTLSVVHLEIIDPDGTSSFEMKLNQGDDLCENLTEAKAEGKIKSLTIDDSYLATFGSRYIREINGYSNNWTVEVNGIKPKGCSLYKPQPGDKIIWRFGV